MSATPRAVEARAPATAAAAMAATILVGALTVAGFAARFGYPWELASHGRPQLAAAAAVLALLSATQATVSWRVAAFAGLLAVVNGAATVAPLYARAPSPPPSGLAAAESGEARLRVLWAHVDADPVALWAAAGLARRERPDVVALTAVPEDAPFDVLFPGHPCRVRPEERSRYAVVVLSRGVCAPLKPPVGGPWPFAAQRARARAPLTVIAAHAPRPFDWRAATARPGGWRDAGRTRLRDEVIAAVGAAAWGDPPALLVGDFNAAPWSPASIDLSRRGLVRVDCGAPWRSTWISGAPVLGLPMDQAFVTPGVAAACRVGPDIGARHRPLIVDAAAL